MTGRTESGAKQVIERLLLVRVRHDDGMVLCTHHALCTLAIKNGAVIDMGPNLSRTNKRHRLDVRVITNQVNRIDSTVNHVEYTRRNSGFHR
ncbi:hypothetical protein D3C75_746110 [compost metagenome]